MDNIEQLQRNIDDVLKNWSSNERGKAIVPKTNAEWIAYAIVKGFDIKNHWNEIPDQYKNFDLFSRCITNCPSLIDYIPKQYVDEQLWCHFAKCVQNPWEISSRLPAEKQTQSIWNNYFLKKGSSFIHEIPKKFRNQELWDFCQEQSPSGVLKTPSQYQTQAGWNNAVKIRDIEVPFEIINKVPEKFKTKELYAEYLKGNSSSIRFVPEKFQNQEMWNDFINDGNKFNFVPEKFQTQDLWDNLIRENLNNIVFVPERFQTQEMWTRYVKDDHDRLNVIPREFRESVAEELKINKNRITNQYDIDFVVDSIIDSDVRTGLCSLTPEVIIALMQKQYCTIEDVELQDITREIVSEYLNLNSYSMDSIKKVPEEFVTQDIWNKCAENSNYNINLLKEIPDEFQTQDMWDHYMESNKNINPQNIPDDFQTQDMWDKFFENNPAQIQRYVDFFGGHFMISQDTWNTYAELHPENIYKIPSQFQTQEMWNNYCKKDSTIVGNNVPADFQTQNMWNNFVVELLSYGKNPKEILCLVPDKFKSEEIFYLLLKASQYSPEIICLIPTELQTQNMWNEFVKIYNVGVDDLKYIPSQFRDNIVKNNPRVKDESGDNNAPKKD